ncbi:MAG: hypothetical protein MHM6MM_001560 [Cercozoa sp. M6MM]
MSVEQTVEQLNELSVSSGKVSSSEDTSTLKTLVASLLVTLLPEEDKQAFQDAFSTLDRTRDGHFSREDVVFVLTSVGVDEDAAELRAEEVFENADLDKDGLVSFDEFILCSARRRLERHVGDIRRVFDELDKDGDGVVSKEEFASSLAEQSPTEALLRVFKAVDANHDGVLSWQEFQRAIVGTVDPLAEARANEDGGTLIEK